jgi:tetratricopeptide (TPR) repeat protein
MKEDYPVAAERPIVAEGFSDGIRVLWTRQVRLKEIGRALDKNPGGKTRRDLGSAATDMSRAAVGEEDYRGAQEARTLAIKAYEPLGRGPSSSENDRDSLASAYGGRSFLDLFVGDWKNALSDADDGLKVDASEIWILTNKAHALLFLGHTTEARKIYLENALKKAYPKDPKSKRFLDSVLDDFEQFRKHPPPGIDLKIIDPIESELKKVQADASKTEPIVE